MSFASFGNLASFAAKRLPAAALKTGLSIMMVVPDVIESIAEYLHSQYANDGRAYSKLAPQDAVRWKKDAVGLLMLLRGLVK